MNRLIELLVNFLELFYFVVVVDCYERAVVLRLGKYNRTLDPGPHWKLPLAIDDVLKANVVRETQELPAQAFTTSDGVDAVASAVVTFCVRDVKRLLLDTEDAEGVLASASRGAILRVLRSRTWASLQAGDDLDEAITTEVRRLAFKWGIEVERVELSDLTRATTYRLLVDGSMSGGGGVEE